MKTSEQINELAGALANAQGEIKDASKSREGYGYTYADLSDILEIARPVLAKNGLALIQVPSNVETPPPAEGNLPMLRVAVETTLAHKSGQWIAEIYHMPVEQKVSNKGKQTLSLAQCIGMTITYCRRYAAAAILGMAQTDNDASIVDFVTGSELKELKTLIAATNSDQSKICEHCGIETLEDISHENFARVRGMLERKMRKSTGAKKNTEDKTEQLKQKGQALKEQMAKDAAKAKKGYCQDGQ